MSRSGIAEENGMVEVGVNVPVACVSDRRFSSASSLDKEVSAECCRVCHCSESDNRGDAALEFLGIIPPLKYNSGNNEALAGGSGLVEFIGPGGEVFICDDLEMRSKNDGNALIVLGCSCKNDLALVHYACALKWFVNHGSTVCEICGQVAKNINAADLKKVIVSLKEYKALRDRTVSGNQIPNIVPNSTDVDADVVSAIRRLRMSEVSLFFHPHSSTLPPENASTVFYDEVERPISSTLATDQSSSADNVATKWAIEGTGILLAVGLLTATLAWLIAPRVGKKTARSGLHILLAGICALTVVIFFRFVVLTRIKYGPARYWAILVIFWFLVFGIWASRTHSAHTT